MSVKVYVEDGGEGKSLKISLRKGFNQFLKRAGLELKMPNIVGCGSRDSAYNNFRNRLADNGGNALLLVDAEEPLKAPDPWEHLSLRDQWHRPERATSDHCHLMVQTMESWFLADPDALKEYYGRGFREQALHGNPQVEKVLKGDVYERLKLATQGTKKGFYDKGKHSFEILEELDPSKVTSASPFAKRFIDTLLNWDQEQATPRR